MAKAPISYGRDYRKDRSEARQNTLHSFHDGFPKKVSVSTAPREPFDLWTHLMMDPKQIAIHYHADYSLTIITAAPIIEVLTQRNSTDEAAELCVFSHTIIGNVG